MGVRKARSLHALFGHGPAPPVMLPSFFCVRLNSTHSTARVPMGALVQAATAADAECGCRCVGPRTLEPEDPLRAKSSCESSGQCPPVEDLVERRPAKGPRIAGARAFEATPCLSPTWAPVSGPLSSPCASHGWAACCPGLLAEALEFDEPWAAAADQENDQIGEPYGLSLELTNGTFSGWTTCPGLLAEALEFGGATRGQTTEFYYQTCDTGGSTLVPRYGSSVKRPLPKICAYTKPRKRRCTLRHRLMRVNGAVRCKPPALGSLGFRPPPLGGSPVCAASLRPSHLTELHPAADCCPPASLGTLGCSPFPVGGSPVFDATLCTCYPGTPAACDAAFCKCRARPLFNATGLESCCCTCGLHAQDVCDTGGSGRPKGPGISPKFALSCRSADPDAVSLEKQTTVKCNPPCCSTCGLHARDVCRIGGSGWSQDPGTVPVFTQVCFTLLQLACPVHGSNNSQAAASHACSL